MKKLVSLLLFSTSLQANPASQEQQVNRVLAMMESMGSLERIAQCINLPAARVKALFRTSFAECGMGNMMVDEPSPDQQNCMQHSMIRHSGIPAAHWQACEQDDAEPQDDPLLAELEALSERIGDREPTSAEQQQRDQIIARIEQRGLAEMEQMVSGLVAGSQGSESMITLPLYPQAQLLINIPAQGDITIAGQVYTTLPGASFVSTDSPQRVLQYYRQTLPDYREHRSALTSATDVALMQTVPPGFDYSRDMGRAFSIPHIYIQPASATEQQRVPGARTLFFLYYVPKG